MVVRLDAGKEAVRAYVAAEAARGLPHVRQLLADDLEAIRSLVDDLSETEGAAVPRPGEWSIGQVLAHLNSSLDRSLARLETLSSGREWTNPPATAGQGADSGVVNFDEQRRRYIDGMTSILSALERADPTYGLELTAEHGLFGPFNWLEWAVYSHHVHTHDHIGQIRETRAAVGMEAST